MFLMDIVLLLLRLCTLIFDVSDFEFFRVRIIYLVLFMFNKLNFKERTSCTLTVSYNMSSCSLHIAKD